ncbi:hypothetical protein GCM10023085_11780 [Actinomadura viridis]|uniref:Secreted protein n=1 Tax=Actinomadura viridis TaxID=58110 RepID=A0A931DRQ5_9ACTN|nr:hypothetical protein [Actinomadura viridis]MBG6093553.1 hypothetical protein [Actinomadura viridis]
MLKRLVISGLVGTAGFMAFAASPAHADGPDITNNNQLVNVQTCRGIDVAGIGAAVHNLLGINNESGDCYSGSVVKKGHHRHS